MNSDPGTGILGPQGPAQIVLLKLKKKNQSPHFTDQRKTTQMSMRRGLFNKEELNRKMEYCAAAGKNEEALYVLIGKILEIYYS